MSPDDHGSGGAPVATVPVPGSSFERLLARRDPAHVEFGLERIRALLDGLDNPERRFRAIHVAGTNGKGSVAATTAAILRAIGRGPTGLYTSPHLIDFAERIALDGEPAPRDLLESAAAEVLPLADAVGATFFESSTALAFAVFARAGIRSAVVEVGLGGRLDATNVLGADVAVVTSIDLDHAAYLGSDPAGIAREKAGIVTEGATLVLGDVTGAPRRELLLIAERVGAHPISFGAEFRAEGVRECADGIELSYRSDDRPEGLDLRSPLRGAHQAANVAAAVAAVDAFTTRVPGGVLSDGRTVARGVAAVRWPGRFQVVRADDGIRDAGERAAAGPAPTHVYDIAHNPAAARMLAALLARAVERGELPRPLVLVAGVLGDKDWREMLGPLLEVCDAAVLTDAPSAPPARRWDLHAAAAALSSRFAPVVDPDFDRALERARERAGSGTVVVTGSCYTVGDALRLARNPEHGNSTAVNPFST